MPSIREPFQARIPSLRLHKPSGNAVVTLNSRDYYVGRYGTPEAQARYHELIGQWLAAGRQPLHPLPFAGEPHKLTVGGLLDAFDRHAKQYYRRADGTLTGEDATMRQAAKPLRELFATEPAESITPSRLKLVRDQMIERGWVRTSINRSIKRLVTMFRWAAENELVPASVPQALGMLSAIKRGRSNAAESEPIRPV